MVGAAAWLMIGATATGPKRPPGATIETKPASSTSRNTAGNAPGAILRCPEARRGLEWYKARYAAHRAIQRLPGPPSTVRYPCPVTSRRAAEWRSRAAAERVKAQKWVRFNYAWWEWLPANWQRLGACETGYGRRPGNWSHANSRFVSAFGISRSIYDRDAAHMGAPPWNDRNPPTPRQQYLAALGHYDLWGDGWSCPGP